jgi:hypothetical protein
MSKGFFHIDRRNWASICDLQKMNMAVAYLVLATGTGAANNVTKWSAKAVETWTGMRRLKAREAIEELIKLGYVMRDPESTQNKPRYTLPGCEGKTPAGELIWLPNALVKGVPTFDGPAPVTQLRMSGDLWTLRLLIDLYHAHHLASDYGVLRGVIRGSYARKKFGEQGLYSIWGFKRDSRAGAWEGPLLAHRKREHTKGEDHPLWQSIAKLERMGLLAFIPHLFANSDPDTEPVHTLGATWQGAEPEEELIRNAAIAAGKAMLQPGQVDQAKADDFFILIPAPHYHEDTQVIGLLRLRFRPHTAATARWYAELVSKAPEWAQRYRALEESGGRAAYPSREWEAWGT